MKFILLIHRETFQNNWVPRRASNDPKTIDEIHQEAVVEKRQKEIEVKNGHFQRVTDRDCTPKNRSMNVKENDFGSVVTPSRKHNNVSADKMKFTQLKMDENTTLGPCLKMNWLQAASNGIKKNFEVCLQSDSPVLDSDEKESDKRWEKRMMATLEEFLCIGSIEVRVQSCYYILNH